jgi:type II secretory pathway pseudopilin PulG
MQHFQRQNGKQDIRHIKVGGFTLIETLVAVMLLSFALLGPFALAMHSLRLSREARQQLTAVYLAQEAIEIAQSVRSNNSADDTSADHNLWMDGIFRECDSSGCVVNGMAPAPTSGIPGIWRKMFPSPDSSPADQIPLQACNGPCDVKANVYISSPGLFYIQSVNAPLPPPAINSGFTRVLVATAPNDPDPGNPSREVVLTATVTYRGYNNALRTVVITETLYNWFPELI